MKGILAIARRDLAATYQTPTGWVVLSVWGLISALVFGLVSFREGEPATLRAVIVIAGWSLAVLAPAISMRSFAEEARLGTLETLQSSPLSAGELVMGKWLACLGVLFSLALPVLILAGVAELYGQPDPGELLSGLVGLLLIGAAMTAAGVMVSTRTSSQVVAYLITFFACFALVLLAKGLPSLLPQILPVDANLAWIDQLSRIDPLKRLDDFAIGLFSTSNVAWFVIMVGFFLVVATVSLAAPLKPRAMSAGRRLGNRISTFAFLLALGTITIGLTVIFDAPLLRVEVDVTKTRAYSLGPGTMQLLEDLEGEWSVRLLVSENTSDPATVRLVDEVLERMSSATPALTAERIDPTDPVAVGRYEALLEGLLDRERPSIDRWETAIDEALVAFSGVRALGTRVAREAADTIGSLPAEDPSRTVLERVGETLGTIAEQGGVFETYLQDALKSTPGQPIPDWPLVRASLVSNNGLYGGELEQLADLLRRWELDPSIAGPARSWAASVVGEVETVAGRLRMSTDDLEALDPLQVSRLGVAIAKGDAAVVEGPTGVMVIPSWQLFPSSAVTRNSGAVIGFDRRFRGEETLAAAIRSLDMGGMPRVVFVHAEERSMLRPREDGMDVSAIVDALATGRIDAAEWIPGRTDRPAPEAGRPTVWVVLPILQRKGLEYGDSEKALIDATRTLLGEGESVLLTPARSMLPLVGQVDPWAEVLEGFGVTVETGNVVYEWLPGVRGSTESGVLNWQAIDDYPRDGVEDLLVGAMRGKRLFLNHPTPIRVADVSGVDSQVIAAIEPSILRFIENDWRGDGTRIDRLPEEKRYNDPQPVVVTSTRGDQRVMVVGSGGWMLSGIVNESGSLGGDRLVLVNPGNRELALSGVAWLAGMDELVATAASGREVARFADLSDGARLGWGITLPLLMGVGPLLIGGLFLLSRRGEG